MSFELLTIMLDKDTGVILMGAFARCVYQMDRAVLGISWGPGYGRNKDYMTLHLLGYRIKLK